MKKRLMLLCLMMSMLSLSLLTSCATQSAQQTAGTTLLAMHDLVKVSAETANTLCIQKTIPADVCAKIKTSYDKFRAAWPIVDDALLVYLKASANDTAATTAFNVANAAFIQDYNEMMALFASSNVLKGAN